MRLTKRNLAGGFLGGMLGILLGGFIYEYLMWAGSLLGFVTGFFWPEISERIRHNVGCANATYRRMTTAASNNIATCSKHLGHAKHFIARMMEAAHVFLTHPRLQYDRALTMVCVGFTTFNIACFAAVFLLVIPSQFWTLVIPFMLIFSLMPIACYLDYQEHKNRQDRYLLFRQQGMAQFCILQILTVIGIELAIVAAACIFLPPFMGFALAFVLCTLALYMAVALPIAIGVGAVQGVSIGARKGGYWPCLVVTVIVTNLIGWLVQPFETATAVWLTAFVAGIASGTCVEGLRRAALVQLKKRAVQKIVRACMRMNIEKVIDEQWGALLKKGEKNLRRTQYAFFNRKKLQTM